MRNERSATRRRVIIALVAVLTLGLSYLVTVGTASQAQAGKRYPMDGVVMSLSHPKHLAAPQQSVTVREARMGPFTSASVTVFKSCPTNSSIYRARMWNEWTQYAGGHQRPTYNTVKFEKFTGQWVLNNWASSANADYMGYQGQILQRRGPLDPPATWEFTYTSGETGKSVRLRGSNVALGVSFDCTALAP